MGSALASFLFLAPKERVIEINSISQLSLPTDKKTEINPNKDIEPQKPLSNPPEEIKAIYLTGWSAGNPQKIRYFINLIRSTELNAVVFDIKDYSGYVAYDIKVSEVEKYDAKQIRIQRINALIKQLHDEGIYVIARLTVFQDPRLAKARPDLAIHSKTRTHADSTRTDAENKLSFSSSTLWLDHKGLAWIDPASKEAWNYNIAIAKEAASRGFDELNFDYIRFASDGNLSDMQFPFWQNTRTDADGTRTHAETKSETIKNFFEELRESLPDVKISADLFGLATAEQDDLGIGQIIEDAYEYFDYVAPMVYPSHYASGFLNFQNPANYPYEVVKYSMERALQRLKNYELGIMNNATTANSTSTNLELKTKNLKLKTKLRPWLQDFDLGADYTAEMVKKEIQAVYDSFCSPAATGGRGAQICSPSQTELGDKFGGWMLWNPSNVYTEEALIKEQ